jgi:hypothetical protein
VETSRRDTYDENKEICVGYQQNYIYLRWPTLAVENIELTTTNIVGCPKPAK